MTNIWGFLLQTLTVSLVAGFLLVLKYLLEDKLSPRWQYGIWALLAVRLLFAVDVSREVLVPLPIWMELLKTNAEQWWLGLTGSGSAFSGVYTPIRITTGIPFMKGMPASLWDWLFVVYIVGVCVVLGRYLASYVRLRILLRRGEPVWPETQARLDAVCKAYGLHGCRVVEVPGLTSAFICGVLRPVLAIPAGREPDEKVLLHELLHLKYYDALQNVFWCILRALHWCNPFLQMVFDRIGNDMEALCDQRVLERLEGEARRAYGHILLDMANEAYARALGTTSLSNGGKNIARRIEAVVRFKKYPRGMGLVSVCMAIVLASPLLLGEASAQEVYDYLPSEQVTWERAMAMTRLNRCTTVAGALDTYAKGLIFENGIYIATASPLAKQEALAEQMRAHVREEQWVNYHLDAGEDLAYAKQMYYLYNIERLADGSYEALLEIPVDCFETAKDEGFVLDEEGNPMGGYVQVPVRVYREHGWVVEEVGTRQRILMRQNVISDYEERIPALVTYKAESVYGAITASVRTVYEIGDRTASVGFCGIAENYIVEAPNIHGEFDYARDDVQMEYVWDPAKSNLSGPMEQVAVKSSRSPVADLQELQESSANSAGGSSDGWSWVGQAAGPKWDGVCVDGNGQGYYDLGEELVETPTYFQIGITWDRELVEVFELGEVAK